MEGFKDNFFAIAAASGLVILLVVFIIVFIFLQLSRKQKYLLERKNLESKFTQEILRTQLEIQEQTLKTISEEIHDNVGQVLSLAKLNLNIAENADPKVQDAKRLVSKAINDLRNLTRSLHGDIISQLELQQAIANELSMIENTKEFITSLIVRGNAYKLDKQKEMILFRVVQEAMNNCIKYSKAKKITVELNYGAEDFSLSVKDDGIGFDTSIATGIGLKSMRNRAAMIGGKFSLSSSPALGTTIGIELPNILQPGN